MSKEPEKFKHSCIKPDCSKTYNDIDPDPYYCPACATAKKAIAQKVDAILASKPRKPKTKSALQIYDEADKVRGFMQIKS